MNCAVMSFRIANSERLDMLLVLTLPWTLAPPSQANYY